MGGRHTAGASSAAAVLVLIGVVGSCAPPPERVAVPGFERSTAVPTRVSTARPALDCAVLLPPEDVTAVLGLPVDGIVSTALRGVPVPGISGLERETCRYTAVDRAWPLTGEVLVLTAARYTDAAAAVAQSRRNAAELGAARPVELGGADAVTVAADGRTVLLAAHGDRTVDLTMSDRAAQGRAPLAVLTDLARRVLAVDGTAVPFDR